MAMLTAEAVRVFGWKASVSTYGRPHYLPMVQVDYVGGYIRVSGNRNEPIAAVKRRLILCLRALPTHTPPKPRRSR